MTLYTKTLALLRAAPRDITLSQIAADSGLELPWISRFKNERIKTPSVHHVQRLHDCLVAYGVGADE